MAFSNLSFAWRSPEATRRFRTGVSLHGHTFHSREVLTFVPRISSRIPILSTVVAGQIERYKRFHGSDPDFSKAWWTPPLSPRQAYQVESGQITALGLAPIVSLTDHNAILAPIDLHAKDPATPISVEWTVPLANSFIHLGIHNLPPSRATELHNAMQAYTTSRDPQLLADVLETLDAIPEVLIVFNHPLWDEPKVGDAPHLKMIHDFLKLHNDRMHAFELNGLRPWSENRLVPALASQYGKPLISGGDRHAREPNACLNLTNATCFAGLTAEIRQGQSEILFANHYRASLGGRLAQNMLEIMNDDPEHDLGWTRWSDRVFWETPSRGVLSLTQVWNGNGPHIVQAFVWLTRVFGHRRLRSAVTLAFGSPQECT